ncbi:endonuclease domain-containing protein [Kitasatospora sp. NPDC059146]|uniref:endonuclease domain-containing protein n=1 Tax=unclassified Kitasatospora TaxID=2633591 RepID=UPI0036C27FBE
MRAHLVNVMGPLCQLCGVLPGAVVDHDHFSGLVRGLLCGVCNTGLESCLHLDVCPRAEYLNAQPAAHLKLPYPDIAKSLAGLRHVESRIAALGYDPFAHLR